MLDIFNVWPKQSGADGEVSPLRRELTFINPWGLVTSTI